MTARNPEGESLDAGARRYVLTLPKIFWDDHFDRCGEHDGRRKLLKEGARTVVVKLDDDALSDLRSDAHYYSDGVDFGGERAAYRSLIRSAQATSRAIERQVRAKAEARS